MKHRARSLQLRQLIVYHLSSPNIAFPDTLVVSVEIRELQVEIIELGDDLTRVALLTHPKERVWGGPTII